MGTLISVSVLQKAARSMAKEILIIENEGLVAGLLSKSLQQRGYSIASLELDEALQRTRKLKPSLIVFEATGPAVSTEQACASLRDLTNVPLIALVDQQSTLEQIDGIEQLSKPIHFRELLAAVENALKQQKRKPRRRPTVLRVGALSLDLQTHRLTNGDQRYRLTPKEFSLLRLFMDNPGQVISHKWIMKEVWETDYVDDLGTLHVHVCWLRRKIEQDPRRPLWLRTVRGVGYTFVSPA